MKLIESEGKESRRLKKKYTKIAEAFYIYIFFLLEKVGLLLVKLYNSCRWKRLKLGGIK